MSLRVTDRCGTCRKRLCWRVMLLRIGWRAHLYEPHSSQAFIVIPDAPAAPTQTQEDENDD